MFRLSGKLILLLGLASLLSASTFAQQPSIRKLIEREPFIEEAEPIVKEQHAPASVPMTFNHVELRSKDEANRDEEFFAFRAELLRALEARDLPFLIAHIADDIKCSLGGCDDINAFRAEWKLDTNPAESKLWDELARVMKMGGTFKRDVFTAPWTFTEFPDEFDAYQFAVVTGRNVNIRQKPRSNSSPMGKVTHLVVRDLQHEETREVMEIIGDDSYIWHKIGLPDGSAGYVYGKFFRSPLDYRAAFRPIDDVWKLTLFLAGD